MFFFSWEASSLVGAGEESAVKSRPNRSSGNFPLVDSLFISPSEVAQKFPLDPQLLWTQAQSSFIYLSLAHRLLPEGWKVIVRQGEGGRERKRVKLYRAVNGYCCNGIAVINEVLGTMIAGYSRLTDACRRCVKFSSPRRASNVFLIGFEVKKV